MRNSGKYLPLLILVGCIISFCGTSSNSFGQGGKKRNRDNVEDSERHAAEFYFIEGEKYFILEDYAKSLGAFQKSLEISSDNAAAYYKMAQIMYLNEQYPEAVTNIKKAIQLDNSNKFFYALSADIYTALGDIESAAAQYEVMVQTIPDTEEYYLELAGLYLYMNKLNDALRVYDEAESKMGVIEGISLQKQQIYLKQNKVKEAINEGQNLMESYPGEPRYVVNLAEVMNSNGLGQDAIDLLHDYLNYQPEDPRVQLQLAEFYRQQKEYGKSSSLTIKSFNDYQLEPAIKIQVLVNYISRFPDERSVRLAKELGQILIELYPDNPDVFLVNADMYTTLLSDPTVSGQRELQNLATKYYRTTLYYDPSNFSVWQNLIQLDLQLSRWDSLSLHAEEALALFPNQPVLYFFKGIGLSQQSDHAGAISFLEQGVKMTQNDPLLRTNFYATLGDAYHAVGNHEKSDASYESALEINPDDDGVLNNYSYYLSLRKEKLDKAKKMSQAVIRRNPNNPTYLDTYAWVLYQLNEFEEAKRILQKVVQSKDVNAVHLDHLGDVLYQMNKIDEAVSYWEQARELDDSIKNIDKKITKRRIIE